MKKNYLCLLSLISILFAASANASPSINWQTCQGNSAFLCGTLSVPENYKHPDKATLQLPVAMHLATGNKLGTIIFNFGGPWSDDSQTVQEIFPYLSSNIQDHFDIVGFAPRGTAQNSITCHSNSMGRIHELERQLNLTNINTSADAKQYYKLTQTL